MTKWVLVTGGIGSGKTTITDLFAQLGVPIIDTDVISRELTSANGVAIPLIKQKFGEAAVTQENALARTWIRHKIFSQPSAKKDLESILHPLIFSKVCSLQDKTIAIYGLLAVPLFSEDSNYNKIIDRILVVDVHTEDQIKRVEKRSQLSALEIDRIIKSQLSREKRNQLADDIILNNGSIDDLVEQVRLLNDKYLELFKYT